MTLPKPEPRELTVTGLVGDASIRLVTNAAGHSTLTSRNLRCDPEEPYAAEYNAAVDGLESILLALWSVGVAISEEQLRDAVETSLASLADEFPS